MADAAPDLIIPVRFAVAGAAQDLQTLNAQTVQATAKTQAAMTASAQQGEKARLQAAQAAAALIAQTNRDLAAKAAASAKDSAAAAKQAADAQAAAAREAADAQKQAAADAFADWKRKADDQHRTAMWMWEDQQAGIQKADGAMSRFGDSMGNVIKGQMALSGLRSIAQGAAEGFKDAADYVRNMAREFISLRKSMQEVASLRGQPNTNEFTLEEAKKAEASGLTPGERRDFQAEFLNYAGSQVGGKDAQEQKAAGTKLTEAQGEEFGNRVAALMKASGVNPTVGAELAGSMLEQAEGPQDVDKLMKRFGKTFQVLQKGRVPLQKALPELSQIMSMGVSAEDAAKMYSIVSPAAAGQEGTSVQAALRAVQEMKNKGTGGEFGVKAGMSQYESVKAFAENINKRQQDLMGQGKTEQEASDIVQKQLADKQVAADSREARGLVRGFGGQGVRLGGFARYEGIEAATPDEFEQSRVQQYRDSPAGKQNQREAHDAVVTAERGQANVKVEELRQEAETQLKSEGRFERWEASDSVRQGLNKYGSAGSVHEQLVSERAYQMALERSGESGGMMGKNGAFGDNTLQVNEKIAALLEKNNDLLTEQNQIMRKDDQRAGQQARPPLAVPPPQRGGGARMGG
jgi:hypothetical protein